MNDLSRAHWSNRLSFILAATGAAVGLGNIWKFPYIAGVNGGGAFVLLYLACVLMVGLPVFIAELYIGQKSQTNPVDAFNVLHRRKSPWRIIGWLGIFTAFLILSYYSVVAGWVLDFMTKSATNRFAGHSDAEIRNYLGELFADPRSQIFWHFVVMLLTTIIVMKGVKSGIERWNRILMPALLVLLTGLLIYSAFLPGAGKAMTFLFSPDFSKLTPKAVIEAVGHSFFTLSLGMCGMITYGSYLQPKEDVIKTAVAVSLMDTIVALMAGVVIFSAIFTFDLEPGTGPSLMFQTLPILFSKMTGGYFVALAFFSLVSFAAITSAIAILEVVVTYFIDHHGGDRSRVTIIAGFLVFTMGISCALSFNVLADFKMAGLTFFDLFDKMASHILMPVGGALVAIFLGWVLGERACQTIIKKSDLPDFFATGLLWTARVLAPAWIFYLLIHGLMAG